MRFFSVQLLNFCPLVNIICVLRRQDRDFAERIYARIRQWDRLLLALCYKVQLPTINSDSKGSLFFGAFTIGAAHSVCACSVTCCYSISSISIFSKLSCIETFWVGFERPGFVWLSSCSMWCLAVVIHRRWQSYIGQRSDTLKRDFSRHCSFFSDTLISFPRVREWF